MLQASARQEWVTTIAVCSFLEKCMENLAPAGSRAALERAEAAGADAVYLGYSAFSARAGAGNFGRQELAEAVRYAHARHMRVHVTLNTLVKDGELDEIVGILRMLREFRVDAVLVQDAGILRIARKLCPGLAIHASTQMAIHNRTGVRWCAKQGITRAVLARECSLDEIRKCAEAGIEIEVFGHGAQCVAVSGLCLMSSMAGERSGNRGRCAQPCRGEYIYRGMRGAWLSPRDVCLRDELDRLEEAGACSVKIEGRLKRPEYAAVVAGAYRRGLDSLREGAFRKAGAAEAEGLRQIYNRGGFMRGYAFGCEDAGVIDPREPRHSGVEIGAVESADGKFARIRLERDLHDGDQLAFRRDGGTTADMIYAGKETPAGETAVLRLREDLSARTGDRVVRLTDAKQMAEAAALPGRKATADMFLRAMPGEKLALTATDGESFVTVEGETVQSARTRAAEAEELARSLRKTGETMFVPGRTEVETEGAFVPVSEVNRVRREALAALEEKRAEDFAPDTGAEGEVPEVRLPERDVAETVIARTEAQAEAARERGFRVVRYPEDWRESALESLLAGMKPGEGLRLPDVCEEATLEMIRALVWKYREKLGGVVLGTIGQLGAEWPVPFGAGSGIPVMNRQAAALLLDEGCEFVTASPELTGKEIAELTAGGAPVAVNVYGRTQLMLLHHCPARTALGLSRGHRECRMCDDRKPEALLGTALEDRMGHSFPLLRQRMPEGCLVRLMNTLPTDAADRKDVRYRCAELTDEDGEAAAAVLDAFAARRKTGMPATGGHWSRAVL